MICSTVGIGRVVRHRPGRELRRAAAEAIHLPRLAGPLVLGPAGLKEGCEILAMNQLWALVIDGRQVGFEPRADGVLMHVEQIGDLFDRIAAVDLDKARVGVAFGHGDLSTRPTGLSCEPLPT